MKIGFVCGEYPPAPHGGIGSVTRLLGRTLAARGHEVRVVGMYSSISESAVAAEDDGVRVWRLPVPKGRFGWARGRRMLYALIAHWAARGEIELVEVPDWEGHAAGWPSLRVPVVTRLHGSITYFTREMHRPFHWPAYCLEAASFHRADYCCSTSEYTARRTARLFGTRLRPVSVLFNPVEIPPEAPARTREPFRVVFAGTLTPKKGLVPLVEAWVQVARCSPGAELHLFGKDAGTDGGRPMRDFLKAMVPPEFEGSLRFHGHVDRERLREEFQTCGLAVFPSYAEAFSMVPMEAMAEGCPVIYSRRCSGPELIEHGVNGLLIDPDRPEEIADAILALMNDPGRCRQLGEEGRRSVAERFSSELITERNEEFYRNCISRHV